MQRRSCIEPLDNRVLLAAAVPIKIVAGEEVATLDWAGQRLDVYAGRWMVQIDGYGGYLLDQQARAATAIQRNGSPFRMLHHMAADGMFLIEAPKTWTPQQVVSGLSARVPGLHVLGPDIRYEVALTPNDPQFGSLWGMHNIGQSGGVVDADIDAPEGWNTATGSSSVVVGIVDTGIDASHPDLNDNIFINTLEIAGNFIDDDANGFIDDIRGWNFSANSSNTTDTFGHGTHVAGTVGAEGNNSTGVVGVNWDVTLVPMKIGTGPGVSGAAAVSSMNYLLALKNRVNQPVNVKVTNHSWGGGGFDGNMNAAIAAHGAAGILTVCAAGNAGANLEVSNFYPAEYDQPNNMSIGNLNRTNVRNFDSNFGVTAVDLFAPGTDILSTWPGNTYASISGTSMASPHVAGTAAWLWSQFPSATHQQIRNAIQNGVEVVPALAGLCVTGGRLDLDGALAAMGAIPAAPATPDLTAGSDTGLSGTDNITFDTTPTFTGTGIQGHTIRIYADGVQVGSQVVPVTTVYSITTTPLSDGVRVITATTANSNGESAHSAPLSVTIDTVAPNTGIIFNYLTAPHSLSVSFSEDVSASLAANDFGVVNQDTLATVNITHSHSPNTSTIGFQSFNVLPDADYRLTVFSSGPGGGIQDVAGNPLAADVLHDFFFLMGDASHDRIVNLSDYNIVSSNYNQSPRNFGQGDLTYDGLVNLADYNALTAAFGNVLTAPQASGAGPSPFGKVAIGSGSGRQLRSLLDDTLA